MRLGILLREDFDGERLRRPARQTKDVTQTRQLLAHASNAPQVCLIDVCPSPDDDVAND